MSYKLIDANALNGVISNDDYEKVLNAPCIYADLPNGIDGKHYVLEPERKKGVWIRDDMWSKGCGMGETYGYYWRCSSCDAIVQGGYCQCGDNFCSNCGADMRGER